MNNPYSSSIAPKVPEIFRAKLFNLSEDNEWEDLGVGFPYILTQVKKHCKQNFSEKKKKKERIKYPKVLHRRYERRKVRLSY